MLPEPLTPVAGEPATSKSEAFTPVMALLNVTLSCVRFVMLPGTGDFAKTTGGAVLVLTVTVTTEEVPDWPTLSVPTAKME